MGKELYPGNPDAIEETKAYQYYEGEEEAEGPIDPSAPTGLTGIDQAVKDALLKQQQKDQDS